MPINKGTKPNYSKGIYQFSLCFKYKQFKTTLKYVKIFGYNSILSLKKYLTLMLKVKTTVQSDFFNIIRQQNDTL